MYNTIIFDVDGTLVDSSEGIKNSIKKVIDKFKLHFLADDELNLFIATSPIQKAFTQYCNVDVIEAQKYSDEYRKEYLAGELCNTVVYNGIYDLLNFLHTQGYKLGIASYKRQDTLEKILSYLNLDRYFQCILGADKENKLTKKDILQHCIIELKSSPQDTIFVGDTLSDKKASEALDCGFIAVTYGLGFKSVNDIQDCNTVMIANNTDVIEKYFKSNSAAVRESFHN